MYRMDLEYTSKSVRSQGIIGNKKQKKNAFIVPTFGAMYFKSPWISSNTFFGEEKLFSFLFPQ